VIEDLFTPMHLLVIFVILFFLFGAKRLPELGKSLGHGIREFRGGIAGLSEDGGGQEPPAATPAEPPAIAAPATAPAGETVAVAAPATAPAGETVTPAEGETITPADEEAESPPGESEQRAVS
jgi:sec-independent protein translocase protein TatA